MPQSPSYAVKIFDSCLALLKKLRKLIVNNPGWSQDETHFIRKAEFEYCISPNIFHDKNVLEIGGSDGYLASLIYALSPSSLVSIDCVPALPSFHNVESSNTFRVQSYLVKSKESLIKYFQPLAWALRPSSPLRNLDLAPKD